MSQPQASVRPLTVLIAALGGEGGGVLTDWIVAAAASQNFPVQSTSIPGVEQRTGATTYHVEMVPAAKTISKARPVLALAPGVGDVDLVVASELMEAGRAIAGGFVTPARTTTIASLSRSYLVTERMAMGDGRYDHGKLVAAVEKNSKQSLLLDLEAIARESGAMINAVMLGAIAAAGALPIPAEAFEKAIRADGKAVNPPADSAMLNILRNNADGESMQRTIDGLSVPHKTGATDSVRTECALFRLQSRVVACGFTKQNADIRWVVDNEGQVALGKIGALVVAAWPPKETTR